MNSKMNLVFWAIVAIESMALIVFVVLDMADTSSNHDGGRSMGRVFFIIAPGVVLVLAVLLHVFVQSTARNHYMYTPPSLMDLREILTVLYCYRKTLFRMIAGQDSE